MTILASQPSLMAYFSGYSTIRIWCMVLYREVGGVGLSVLHLISCFLLRTLKHRYMERVESQIVCSKGSDRHIAEHQDRSNVGQLSTNSLHSPDHFSDLSCFVQFQAYEICTDKS